MPGSLRPRVESAKERFINSSTVRNVTTAVLIVLVGVALAITVLRPTAQITVHPGSVEGVEAAYRRHRSRFIPRSERGFRMLGISFSEPTYRVRVMFTAPPDCWEVTASTPSWPTLDERCGPVGAFSGDISGKGRAATGDTIVGVEFTVAEACFATLALNDIWPADRRVCWDG